MPPPEVAVVTVQPQSVPATFEYVGQTAGAREVEVRARVTGIVLKRNYREGAPVAQGQSMFTIDPAPFEVAAARAEAALASAEAKLAQAKRNSARLKPLFEIKAASQKDFDDAASAEQVAEAEVKTARANLADARLNLGSTRVEGPIAGIASRAPRPPPRRAPDRRHRQPRAAFRGELRVRSGRTADDRVADRPDLRSLRRRR